MVYLRGLSAAYPEFHNFVTYIRDSLHILKYKCRDSKGKSTGKEPSFCRSIEERS